MSGFKEPGFADRQKAAAQARANILEKFRARPGADDPAVKAREVAWYRRAQQPFGLPLDSRADFTKTDWTHWSATLSGRREDFEALVEPLWRNADETPDRVPLCDWVKTREPRKVNMIARPVVGGYFLPLLQDPATWSRWRKFGSREAGPASGWAPLPLAAPAP